MTLKSVALLYLLVGFASSFSPGGWIVSQNNRITKVPVSNSNLNSNTALFMSALSDAEELLRKARALREQAEADEANLHTSLITKKQQQDQETDRIIEKIFPLDLDIKGDLQACNQRVASIIETERFSGPQLKKVVERLHEREIAAKGLDHVEPSLHHTHVKFERVSNTNAEELNRVEGLIKILIDSAAILDEKALKAEEAGKGVKHQVDKTHWCSGHLASTLSEIAHFLEREHDEQFKNRLDEYYEAARKKNVQDKGDRTSMFP